ncbi:hypothetical protein [Kingella potus]|uniref:hypothetical protein n=1 Tax=Kingella potus TaxID=265175 RepID=UPI001FD5827E|nr:hypothetical protein [Kingella potus]UOP00748.1 hypothetical protein LVJ84_13380 [Kingella potus]
MHNRAYSAYALPHFAVPSAALYLFCFVPPYAAAGRLLVFSDGLSDMEKAV